MLAGEEEEKEAEEEEESETTGSQRSQRARPLSRMAFVPLAEVPEAACVCVTCASGSHTSHCVRGRGAEVDFQSRRDLRHLI